MDLVHFRSLLLKAPQGDPTGANSVIMGKVYFQEAAKPFSVADVRREAVVRLGSLKAPSGQSQTIASNLLALCRRRNFTLRRLVVLATRW